MLNQVQQGARPLPSRPSEGISHRRYSMGALPSLPHGDVRPGGPHHMGAKPSFPHGEVRPGGPNWTDKPLPGGKPGLSDIRPIPGKPACPMPKDGFEFSTPGSKGQAEGVGIRNGSLKVEGVSEGYAGKMGEGKVKAEDLKEFMEKAKQGEVPDERNAFQRAWDWATGN